MQALARLVGLQSVTVRKTTGNDDEVATIIFYKMKLSLLRWGSNPFLKFCLNPNSTSTQPNLISVFLGFGLGKDQNWSDFE